MTYQRLKTLVLTAIKISNCKYRTCFFSSRASSVRLLIIFAPTEQLPGLLSMGQHMCAVRGSNLVIIRVFGSVLQKPRLNPLMTRWGYIEIGTVLCYDFEDGLRPGLSP